MLNEINIQGETVVFLSRRIHKDERRENLFYYELRHGDDWGIPLTVEENVLCNYYGTVVSKKPLNLNSSTSRQDCYYELTEEEQDAFVCM